MATRSWNKNRATERVNARIASLPVKDIESREYVRDTDLGNLPRSVAYCEHHLSDTVPHFPLPSY
jgi:hypothetical protein